MSDWKKTAIAAVCLLLLPGLSVAQDELPAESAPLPEPAPDLFERDFFPATVTASIPWFVLSRGTSTLTPAI